jgi:peroxiredoxin
MKSPSFLSLFVAISFSSLAYADSVATVKPLPFDEFKKIAANRAVTIGESTKATILKFANGLDPIPPPVAAVVKSLRNDAKSISLEALMPLLEPQRGQAVSMAMSKHDDPLVRFVAGIVLAGSGVSDAAKSVDALIHDESLSALDKRLIRTWCDGVGIRAATDDADKIFDHLTTAMAKTPKYKRGDKAPAFEVTTIKGNRISSSQFRGKVVVLHFWSTTCAPCMMQMPSHIKLLSKYDSDAITTVFVSLDNDKEAFESAISKVDMPFHNVREANGWAGELTRAFGVNLIPFDVVIDRDGIVFSNSINDIDAALAGSFIPSRK